MCVCLALRSCAVLCALFASAGECMLHVAAVRMFSLGKLAQYIAGMLVTCHIVYINLCRLIQPKGSSGRHGRIFKEVNNATTAKCVLWCACFFCCATDDFGHKLNDRRNFVADRHESACIAFPDRLASKDTVPLWDLQALPQPY